MDAAGIGDGDGDGDGDASVSPPHDAGNHGGLDAGSATDAATDASLGGSSAADAGKLQCGVRRTFSIEYSAEVSQITADSSHIYDPNLFKDGVLDTTCVPAMMFDHVAGYGSVEITGCVDKCGAYVTTEASLASVVFGENACDHFQTAPEPYGVAGNAGAFHPPCEDD
ncbi:MAG: hypothetical protein QM778_03320 [Myxococcales bacterium]